MPEGRNNQKRCNCGKTSALFIAAVFIVVAGSAAAFAADKKILNDYLPVFGQGVYAIHTNFDGCRINLNLYKGDRLWFNGGWAAFIDQGKSKEIKATDSHIIQSNVSWSVKPPASYQSYWLWVACDPPGDPLGISLSDKKNICSENAKGLNAEKKNADTVSIIQMGKWKGNLHLIGRKNPKDAISFGFCIYDDTHEIFGGGEFSNKEENFSGLLDILNSIAVVDQ